MSWYLSINVILNSFFVFLFIYLFIIYLFFFAFLMTNLPLRKRKELALSVSGYEILSWHIVAKNVRFSFKLNSNIQRNEPFDAHDFLVSCSAILAA